MWCWLLLFLLLVVLEQLHVLLPVS